MSVFRHSAAALTALIGAPVAAVTMALRPSWRDGWRERIGGGDVSAGGLWVHAASVGEVTASARLVTRLRERGHALTLSTTSTTGRALCARLHPDLPHRLAPLDHPWCVDRALRAARPRALVLVEAELWPVWIAACARAGVPVVVVSGRISDRSFPRYQRIASLLSGTLGRLHAIGARTEQDRDRFVALGAPADRVAVTGDLKLDPPDAPPAPSPELLTWLGDAPRVVAGSTRPGEEVALLAAQTEWERAGHRATLLLAPRHPDRAKEVAAMVRGRRVSLRSAAERPLAAGDVGVLDTLGELAGAYAGARIAFVGGTLVPVGGHNVLEPAIVETPVVYGPHVSNARHTAEMLERAGAAQRVDDAAGLARVLVESLADAEACRARGSAGRAVLDLHRGSSERSADWIERALVDTPRLASGEGA